MMVYMERKQHLDGKQSCVLNEQILQIFPKENYYVMHKNTTRLYLFYRENGMAILVLLKLAGVWQGCQYPRGFLEKSHVSFTKPCTALSTCIFSLCDCRVTLCGLLSALQKASCSLRLSDKLVIYK